jgi:hypothetical protein
LSIAVKTADGWQVLGVGGDGDCDLVGGVAGWAAIESVSGTADLVDLKAANIAPATATADDECPGTYNIVGDDGVVYRVAVWTASGGSIKTSGGLVDALLISAGSGGGIYCGNGGRLVTGLHALPTSCAVQVGQVVGNQGRESFLGDIIAGRISYVLSGGEDYATGAGATSQPNELHLGVKSSITGVEETYGRANTSDPKAHRGDGSDGQGVSPSNGTVIVRVPASKVTATGGWV